MKHARVKRSLALALAALATGCSLKTPPSIDDVAAKALPATTIAKHWQESNRTEEAHAVAPERLTGLVSPELKKLIDEALAHNLTLRQSASRMLAVAQYVNIAGARLLPTVGVVAAAGDLRNLDNKTSHNSDELALALGWELDIWGKARAGKSASEAHYLSAKLDYAYARQSIIALTAQSWYIALDAEQNLAYQQKLVALHGELFAMTQDGYQLGKQSLSAVLNAKKRLQNSRFALAAARNSNVSAKRNLEKLLGRYPAGTIAVAQADIPSLPPLAASVPSTLVNRRPDLMASYYRVISAFREQEVSELNLLPDISLTLDVGKFNDFALSLLNLTPWLMHSAVGMTLPLYEGGARKAEISIRDAQQQQAVAAYGGDVLNAFYQVEQGLTNETTLKEQFALLQTEQTETEQKLALEQYRYQTGAISRQPLLSEQIALETVRNRAQNAQYALLINRITLELALGGVAD